MTGLGLVARRRQPNPEPPIDATTTTRAPSDTRPLAVVQGGNNQGSEPARVLVFDQGGVVGPLVRTSAATLPGDIEVVECTTARQLTTHLIAGRFDLLVAGPGLDTRAGLERLRIIREERPTMTVILVTAHLGEHDARDVVRAGAVDAIELPLPADKLADAIERGLLIARRTNHPARDDATPGAARAGGATPGRVITIASASGGCGKTFLATNLAWFLTRHGGRRVCILDFDLQFGEVTSTLRLRPRYTVTDLIQQSDEGEDGIDDYLEEYCEVHETGIHVLAAPRDPTEAARLKPEDIGRVIDAARARFDDVIIDTPPALADTVVVAFNRSDELYVMATLDVPSIRNMQVFLGTLDRLQVPTEGIRLVLNKAELGAGIEVRQVLKVFPQGFEATLPYAREVQRSINTGNPVLVTSPSTDISLEMGAALARLLPPEMVEEYERYESAHRPGRIRRWARKDSVLP